MKYKYPIRMKSKETGNIFDFTSLTRGIVVECPTSIYRIGEAVNSLYAHTNTTIWERFTPIWLEQKK